MNSNIPPVQDQVHVTQVKSTNVHVPTPKFFMPVFLTVIISTLIYIGFQLSADLSHVPALNLYSLILLATALFIALGFEFVNGFHDTTNAIMAALWIHDLRNPASVANPENKLEHPLELMMHGANHGGLWRVAYLARTALPFAALYGFAADKLPLDKVWAKFKK